MLSRRLTGIWSNLMGAAPLHQACAVALTTDAIAGPIFRVSWCRYGVVAASEVAASGSPLDEPRPGEVQRWSVPRTGGYAMLVGLWLALLVAYVLRDRFLIDPELGPEWNPSDDLRMLGLVLGSLCIVPLALLDDRRRLGPFPQLAGQPGGSVLAGETTRPPASDNKSPRRWRRTDQ